MRPALSATFVVAALGAAAMLEAAAALAQVPPHTPGTICFTPTFWCWAPYPGPPGSLCYCPSPYGWVAGTLG